MRSELFDIYKGKTVLITGHTGFKGSWLSIWLNELGARIIGYALDPYSEKDNFILSGISNSITDIRGDVRDFSRLKRVFDKYSPIFVFHMAAQSIVRESYLNPKETYDINIGGTVNVLECVRNSKSVKVIINVTSDKCYENRKWIWGYRENDPLGGYDPYSSSKGCSELITSAFRNSFINPEQFKIHNKALSSVRAGNIIGGGDWAKDRIIPDCVRALENKKPVTIRNPSAIRPWQFILEPLCGYLYLATKMYNEPQNYSGAWNFGPNRESIISVKEMVEIFINKYGEGSWQAKNKENQFHEASLLALDISKAICKLSWKPVLNLEEAIENTVDWYKSYRQVTNMYNFCRRQIYEYIKKIK